MSSWEEGRAAHRADHEAGRHADRAEYVTGCPPLRSCPRGRPQRRKTCGPPRVRPGLFALRCRGGGGRGGGTGRLQGDGSGGKEGGTGRSTVGAPGSSGNPDAVAWRCASCGEKFTDGGHRPGPGAAVRVRLLWCHVQSGRLRRWRLEPLPGMQAVWAEARRAVLPGVRGWGARARRTRGRHGEPVDCRANGDRLCDPEPLAARPPRVA